MMKSSSRRVPLLAWLFLIATQNRQQPLCAAQDTDTDTDTGTNSTPVMSANLDQFTYRTENYESDINSVYPPNEWNNVRCADVMECLGWPDHWETGIGWELRGNDCRWCPADGGGSCGGDHQSPIDLDRNRAIAGDSNENECIDVHWMKYYDSSCSWDELKRLNAFSIERHALKVVQPVELVGGSSDTWRIMCADSDGEGRRFGRIDFSKGFSQWWHLSHLDLHVPSEHTQEGKRYAGEIQLHHFYSVSEEEAGVANQMATVAFFLESYEDSMDYDVLNKLICQWRKVEDETRAACGLPSVYDEYAGCFLYRRGYDNTTTPADADGGGTVSSRNLRATTTASSAGSSETVSTSTIPLRPKALSPHDALSKKYHSGSQAHRIRVEEHERSDEQDFDWDAFIQSVYDKEEQQKHGRHLIDYDHVDWFNYFPLLGCKTEYYFRYSGTQTVPPCYARYDSGNNGLGNRGNTNHWRVMKDPIRVSERQVLELHRLIRERIAPPDDPLRACRPDTAAAPDPYGSGDDRKISVARPLQQTQEAHFEVFCECKDWGSKWNEDKEWCKMSENERLFDRPYNYMTAGF